MKISRRAFKKKNSAKSEIILAATIQVKVI